MKNYFLLFVLFLIFIKVQAQQKLTLKTTESYTVEAPLTYGDFQHKDEFMTWQLDFNNKKMTYNNGNLTKTFNFTKVEANQNSTEEKSIYNFENSQESLTVITGSGNYLKIKLYSAQVPNSNPTKYNSIKVFTNYPIDNFNQLLAD